MVIVVVGMAGNALIIYAMVASKQHKKHVLILHQNALDFFSSLFLVINYVLKLRIIELTSARGYWLCVLSGSLAAWGFTGSVVNLAIITIDRYLRVVHRAWSKKRLHPWVIHSAMAFAWFVGIVTTTPVVFETSRVINGACYSFAFYKSDATRAVVTIYYVFSFYFLMLVIFIFCYGRILVAIRRQAKVMAAHGPSTRQAQSNKIESNIIKTMILVSALYAIAWLPNNVYGLLMTLDLLDPVSLSRVYATVSLSLLYTGINPFIYATKFDPVTQILRKIIPCKNSAVQPTDGPVGTSENRISDRRNGQDRD